VLHSVEVHAAVEGPGPEEAALEPAAAPVPRPELVPPVAVLVPPQAAVPGRVPDPHRQ
jgi:hypothetical protein